MIDESSTPTHAPAPKMKAWMGGARRKLGVERRSKVAQQRRYFAAQRARRERNLADMKDDGHPSQLERRPPMPTPRPQKPPRPFRAQEAAQKMHPQSRPTRASLVDSRLGRDVAALQPMAYETSGVVDMAPQRGSEAAGDPCGLDGGGTCDGDGDGNGGGDGDGDGDGNVDGDCKREGGGVTNSMGALGKRPRRALENADVTVRGVPQNPLQEIQIYVEGENKTALFRENRAFGSSVLQGKHFDGKNTSRNPRKRVTNTLGEVEVPVSSYGDHSALSNAINLRVPKVAPGSREREIEDADIGEPDANDDTIGLHIEKSFFPALVRESVESAALGRGSPGSERETEAKERGRGAIHPLKIDQRKIFETQQTGNSHFQHPGNIDGQHPTPSGSRSGSSDFKFDGPGSDDSDTIPRKRALDAASVFIPKPPDPANFSPTLLSLEAGFLYNREPNVGRFSFDPNTRSDAKPISLESLLMDVDSPIHSNLAETGSSLGEHQDLIEHTLARDSDKAHTKKGHEQLEHQAAAPALHPTTSHACYAPTLPAKTRRPTCLHRIDVTAVDQARNACSSSGHEQPSPRSALRPTLTPSSRFRLDFEMDPSVRIFDDVRNPVKAARQAGIP